MSFAWTLWKQIHGLDLEARAAPETREHTLLAKRRNNAQYFNEMFECIGMRDYEGMYGYGSIFKMP